MTEETTGTPTEKLIAQASKEFEDYFLENYPPNCVIGRPAWHVPKLFRAATRLLEREVAALTEQLKAEKAKILAPANTDWGRGMLAERAALTAQRDDEKRLKNEVTLLAHRYKQRLEDAEAQRDELQKRIGYTAVPQDSRCESPPSLGHMFEGHERHSYCPCVRQAWSLRYTTLGG